MVGAVFIKGMGMGAALIVAIGAQNAFLLRQGLQRQHVLLCTAVCIACDVLLIGLGATSMGRVIAASPTLLDVVRVGGALFLLEYGRRAALAAWRGPTQTLAPGGNAAPSRVVVLRTVLALSLLNPHAWLDTVVLLGSIGAQQPAPGQAAFAGGAMLASVLWFTALGLGARRLAPVFALPNAWRVLDGVIALTMWSIAVSLFL